MFFVKFVLETNAHYVLPPLLCSSKIWCMHHALWREELVKGNRVLCPDDSCQGSADSGYCHHQGGSELPNSVAEPSSS